MEYEVSWDLIVIPKAIFYLLKGDYMFTQRCSQGGKELSGVSVNMFISTGMRSALSQSQSVGQPPPNLGFRVSSVSCKPHYLQLSSSYP